MSLSPAQTIREFLITEELGTDPDDGGEWPIYVAGEPDSPDSCIAVYDTFGVKDGRLMSGENIMRPGMQVRVRAADYREGYAKIHAIQQALRTLTAQIGPPLSLGMERGTSRRFLFTTNLLGLRVGA